MKKVFFSFLVALLLMSCVSKQTKSNNTDREIDILVERIKDNTADGYYGSMTQLQIERLLYLTSPRYQNKLDKKTKDEINFLLYRIREKSREEESKSEDDKEHEVQVER